MGLFDELDAVCTPERREQILKPPFNYPGGKTRSFANILPHLPYRKSYIEPFGGSAAILLARQPSGLDVYNDRWSGVVDFYRCIRDPELYVRLSQRLEATLFAREEFYIAKRDWESTSDIVERAALWYTLSVMSFSSMGRNFGRNVKAPMVCPLRSKLPMLGMVHERFKKVQIENLDWRYILKDYDNPDAVFYIDPPYLTSYKQIYKFEMSQGDHIELLEMIMNLKGFAAISGYQSDLYDSYKWTDRIVYNVRQTLDGHVYNDSNYKGETSKNDDSVSEVLWVKG